MHARDWDYRIELTLNKNIPIQSANPPQYFITKALIFLLQHDMLPFVSLWRRVACDLKTELIRGECARLGNFFVSMIASSRGGQLS